jgi:hypothetical protein
MNLLQIAVITVILSAFGTCAACEGVPTSHSGAESVVGITVEALSTSAAIVSELLLSELHAASQESSWVVPTPEISPLQEEQERKDLIPILTLSMVDIQPVGAPLTVDVQMVNQEGRTIPNMVLIVFLNGEQIRRARTDQDGQVSIYLGRNVSVGTYEVQVNFIGTRAYQAVSVTDTVTIRPAHLIVRTVPPLPGISISFAEKIWVTGEDGILQFEVDQLGTHYLKILPLPEPEPDSPVQIQFARWDDAVFVPERGIEVRGDDEMLVGFELSYLIDKSFVDLAGIAVDPARLTSLTVKSSTGTRYVYEDIQPRWYKASRIVRLRNGLESSPIQYGMESVIIDGTNVVNQNQQRFLVTGKDTWTIELLLYSMRLRGMDAIFGFPIGSSIDLTYPAGRVESFAFDGENGVYLDSLARGLYKVQVKGASGMAPLTPVALSRDQDVELKVLSSLDIAVGIAFGAILAFGLLLYGRPQVVTMPYRLVRNWRRPHVPQAAAQRLSSDYRIGPSTSTSRSQMFNLIEAAEPNQEKFIARSTIKGGPGAS